MVTLGQRLTAVGGRPTGFDYLRLGLAAMVIIIHSVGISHGAAAANRVDSTPGLHAIAVIVLPMFFD